MTEARETHTTANASEGRPVPSGRTDCYLGIDIGSISTKGVIIDADRRIIARTYLWTEGNPADAARRVVADLGSQVDRDAVRVRAVGTTGSARRLVGAMCGATVVKNEITAHAVGTTFLHPDVRTILEIGGQDSKIICVESGIAVDYAMNTLCAAGTGAFLSSQAHRLGVEVEEFGDIALTSKKPANIAARCTVFAESDLVHKIQVGYAREDIIAGLCRAVATNYLNNVGKGKQIAAPVVFQGGVSKNAGVVQAFRWAWTWSWTRTATSWARSAWRCWPPRPLRAPGSPATARRSTSTRCARSSSSPARWSARSARTTARSSASTATGRSSTPGATAVTKAP